MAYIAFCDVNNKNTKTILNIIITLLNCHLPKTKKPISSIRKRYGFYIFIGRGRFETCPYKHLYYNNLHLLTIEDYVKQLQAGLLAPGSSY